MTPHDQAIANAVRLLRTTAQFMRDNCHPYAGGQLDKAADDLAVAVITARIGGMQHHGEEQS